MLPYFHLNQASTVHYMAERDGDLSHPSDLFTLVSDASKPCRPRPIIFDDLQDRRHIQEHPFKHQASEQFLISGTSDCLVSNTVMVDEEDAGTHNLNLSLCDHYVKGERTHVPSCSWMPSKMPVMKNTMDNKWDLDDASHARPEAMQAPDRSQQQSMQDFSTSNQSNSPCGIVRVCSDCRTTKTPLWRSGPCGPKSLCNACGIRQRKARRAMAVAAAAAAGGLLPPHRAPTPAKMRKHHKKLDVVPLKKRCKPLDTASSTAAQAKLSLEDVTTLRLSTSSTFDRVLPQDEKDAAILLMGLSCGIIRS